MSGLREMMEALREAAEKAEPGNWHLYEVGDDPAPCPATEAGTSLLTVVEEDGASFAAVYDRDTANYIALANPQTLTLLLQHVERLEGALSGLVGYVERNACHHENTHRGGVIWTICDDCGRKWADDRGGFVPYTEPDALVAAYEALSGGAP